MTQVKPFIPCVDYWPEHIPPEKLAVYKQLIEEGQIRKHQPGRKRWKITRPDTDNLNKLLKDVMTDMGFWEDDALISMEYIWKVLSDEPGIWICVEELDPDIPFEGETI